MLARVASALLRRADGQATAGATAAAAAAATTASSRAASTSAPAAPGGAGIASGVPDEFLKREVVIYAPARTPSQQGMSNTATTLGKGGAWRIEFETKPKWVNPLMGWTSTADPYENVGRAALSFDSADAAAAFCDTHGWTYTIRQPAPVSPNVRPKRYLQYGDNFSVKRKGIPEGGLVSENGFAAAAAGGGGGGGGSAAPAKRGGGKKKA